MDNKCEFGRHDTKMEASRLVTHILGNKRSIHNCSCTDLLNPTPPVKVSGTPAVAVPKPISTEKPKGEFEMTADEERELAELMDSD